MKELVSSVWLQGPCDVEVCETTRNSELRSEPISGWRGRHLMVGCALPRLGPRNMWSVDAAQPLPCHSRSAAALYLDDLPICHHQHLTTNSAFFLAARETPSMQ